MYSWNNILINAAQSYTACVDSGFAVCTDCNSSQQSIDSER